MIRTLASTLAALALAAPAFAQSDPFGNRKAPMVMRDTQGHELARGELTQVRSGDKLDVTIVFHFPNGRTTTETSDFTLRPTVVQHAWRYEDELGGKVTRRFFANFDEGTSGAMKLDDKGKPDTWVRSFDKKPGTYYSGVGFVYAVMGRMNELMHGPLKLQAVGFLPKPVTAPVLLRLDGTSTLKIQGRPTSALKVTIHPDLGWIVKMIAHPQDFYLWFTTSQPTRFLQSQAPILEANDPMVIENVLGE